MEMSVPLSMNKGTLALFICVMFPATKYFVPVLNDATQIVFSTGAVGEQGRGETDAAAAVFVEDASAAATASGGDAAAAALVGDADAATTALVGGVDEATALVGDEDEATAASTEALQEARLRRR